MKKISFIISLLILGFGGFNSYAAGNNVNCKTHIIGHWNYANNEVQPVYVVSDGDDVELFINGISFGHGRRDFDVLYIFDNVIFQPGDLTAVSYDWKGNELSRHTIYTAGTPAQLILSIVDENTSSKADGEDQALIQFEVADFQGKRCGNDSRAIFLEIDGDAEWSENTPMTNNAAIKEVRTDHGVNRAIIKKKSGVGDVKITASAKGLAPAYLILNSK